MFFRLLFESFRRQRRRKLLAGVAILLGTTAVTAMLALATTIGDRIHRELAVYGANIVLTPKAANLAVNIGGVDLRPATDNASLHESDLSKLQTIFWANNITAVSPELTRQTFVINLQSYKSPERPLSVPVTGAWFTHNFGQFTTGLPQLHPSWKLVGKWPQGCTAKGPLCDGPETVITADLASRLGLRVGDRIDFSNSGSIGTFWPTALVGIVTTDDPVEDHIFVDLHDAQTFFPDKSRSAPPDAVSRVEVSARTKPEDSFARRDPDTLSPADRDRWYCRPYANSIAYQIREAIPEADAQQVRRVEQSEGNVLKRISGLMWLISAAALLAAGFAVSAAMATAVLERRAEIGLMRALGASRGSIALLFYVEAAILALVAGMLGYLGGSALAAALGAHIFNVPGTDGLATTAILAPEVFNPVLLPIIAGLALAVSIAGSTPAIRSALRLDPSAILRSEL